MNIIIKEIPEGGQELSFDAAKDGWFREVLTQALPEMYHKEDEAKALFNLMRTGANVDCQGDVLSIYHPICSRCLKIFKSRLDVPIHLTLAPLYESERQLKLEDKDEVALIKEDLEFSFYEGETFSLSDIIREQIILAIPLQPLCKTSCKGLCQQCGKDLNEGPCGCSPRHEDPRWRPLKSLKLEK